jgi:hypothetical protein
MAYGQTGAGKTHTISGGAWKNNGLIQQYVSLAIYKMRKYAARTIRTGAKWSIKVTMN